MPNCSVDSKPYLSSDFISTDTCPKNISICWMIGPVSCVLGVQTSIHAEGILVSHSHRLNEARTMVEQPIAECHPPCEIWFKQLLLDLNLERMGLDVIFQNPIQCVLQTSEGFPQSAAALVRCCLLFFEYLTCQNFLNFGSKS